MISNQVNKHVCSTNTSDQRHVMCPTLLTQIHFLIFSTRQVLAFEILNIKISQLVQLTD